jgi:hypothetical protein
MFTVKVDTAPGAELIVEAQQVRSEGKYVYYENENGVEIGIGPLENCSVYVMNDNGATVSRLNYC